jgi:hypothetical protein
MAFGSIYSKSWWGNANESNSWGILYPVIAGGSTLVASLTDFVISAIRFTIDETEI